MSTKGANPRCWVRLRFEASDGTIHEREFIADTGCPCGIILGQADMGLLSRASAPGKNSNFGHLTGGWLELLTPEVGLAGQIVGYGSDNVFQAVQSESNDFAGLVGLPLLRKVEYGGDDSAFWIRKLPPRAAP